MKIIIFIFIAMPLVTGVVRAQGTIYLSNINQQSAGSLAIANNSWWAAGFFTGNNVNGYMLNSIQLAMVDTSNNPSNFEVMIYSALPTGGVGNSIASLNGSLNPNNGIFNYTPANDLILSQNTGYFIVLTAGTALESGAYEWSYASTYSYNPSAGWSTLNGVFDSNNGSNWHGVAFSFPQFAITATPVPEPAAGALLFMGGLGFLCYRGKANLA